MVGPVDLVSFLNGTATPSGLVGLQAIEPAAKDGANRGYVVGGFWNNTVQGVLHQCVRAAPPAVWQPVTTRLPGDSVAGLVAAYGIRLVVASYGTGPAFDVQTTSGGTVTTIPFLPSGLPNYSLMDEVCAGLPPRVSKWYDQSGGGFHATQASFAAMPTISPLNVIGGARSLVFDAVVRGAAQTALSMTIPAGMTVPAAGGLAMIGVGRFGFSAAQGAVPLFEASNTNAVLSVNLWNGTGTTCVLARAGGNNIINGVTALGPQRTPQVIGVNALAPTISANANDAFTSVSGFAAPTAPYAGGTINKTSLFGSGQNEFGALLIGPGMPQPAYQSVVGNCYAAMGIAPQILDQLIPDGDSRTEGFAATLLQAYVQQLERLISRPLEITNVALYGDTMVNRALNFQANVAPYYNAAARVSVITNAAGINDFTGGNTPQNVFNAALSWVSQVKALGTNTVPVLITVPPAAALSSAVDTNRTAYNAMVVANAMSYGYKVVDLAADPTVGNRASYNGFPNAYSPDGLHWTTLMSTFVAEAIAPIINSSI